MVSQAALRDVKVEFTDLAMQQIYQSALQSQEIRAKTLERQRGGFER